MIPADAAPLAFLVCVAVLVLLPSAALLVAFLVIDRRVRAALATLAAAQEKRQHEEQQRLDGLVRRLLAGPQRRPMGFVLHEGDEARRPRGDGSGGVLVWWRDVGTGED